MYFTDVEEKEEVDYSHYDEGSGFWEEFDDTEPFPVYGDESEDQTEPPLYITEENDRYKKPTAAPPGKGTVEDFTFFDENNSLEIPKIGISNKNAKSSQHSTKFLPSSSSDTKLILNWFILILCLLL